MSDTTGHLDGEAEADSGVATQGLIQPLPKTTVRLIGSTQVLTSVVSVVKELVENSIDAASTSIEIKLENYGFDKIEVRDNGKGIHPSDAPCMGRPHYTSKLSQIDDLCKLQTYGFRGEALGSLCAVSRVSVITKTSSEDVGMMYELDNDGFITSKKPSHLGQGTSVIAAQLFQSVPVRRQYYSSSKRRKDELKKVEDLIMAFSIIRHDVRFVLHHNREVLWQKSSVSSYRQVLIQVLGSSLMSHMEHRHHKSEDDRVEIELYVPKKDVDVQITSRASGDRNFIFINRRPVVHKDILKCVKQMYMQATSSESGRYPICFISLVIPPEETDVNLEPNKTMVSLQNKDFILQMLRELLVDVYPCKQPTSVSKELDDSCPSRDESDLSNAKRNFEEDCSVSGNTDSSFDSSTVKELRIGQCHVPEVGIIETPERKPYGENTDPTLDSSIKEVTSQDMSLTGESFLNKEPVLNSTRCDGQDPVISTQSITFNLLHDEDKDDLFGDLDLTNCNTTKHESLTAGKPSREPPIVALPSLPAVPMCGTTKECVINRPGTITEKNVSLQERKDSSCLSADTLETGVDPTSSAAKSWSKGSSVEDDRGKRIAPVQLLVPGAQPRTHQDSPSSSFSSTPCGNKTRHPADMPGQMSLVDVAALDHMEQPTSSFIEFSKQLRPSLIKENPNTDLRDIGKMIAERWNKLTDEEQENHGTSRTNTSMRNNSARKDTSLHTGPSLKKRKISNNDNSMSVLEMLKSPKPPTVKKKLPRPPLKAVSATFSMAHLKKKYSEDPIRSQCLKSDGLHLVGEVKSAGWWVGLQGNTLTALVPWRMQECLIFHHLMEFHSLPTDKLDDPISLTPSNIDDGQLKILLSLKSSIPGPSDMYSYCTDPRISRNGFSIRKTLGPDQRVDIVSLASHVPMFGLTDLREILKKLSLNSSAGVRETRPNKIMHYLQGEAVRMMRQMPQRASRTEMYDFLEQIRQKLPENTTQCFHQKPLLHDLHILDTATPSQLSQ